MTKGSNCENGESQQPERDRSASSVTSSEPGQLDLFEPRTGVGEWAKAPRAPSASRDSEAARGPFADWADGVSSRAAIGHDRLPWAPKPVTCGNGRSRTPNCRSDAGLVADVARPFRHRPAHGQPVSRRHYARRARHRSRRICARRASRSTRSTLRADRQEGRGVLRSRRAAPSAIPSSGFGVKRDESRQGCRMPIRQEALRHPADDPPRHRTSLPLDREAPARGRFQ